MRGEFAPEESESSRDIESGRAHEWRFGREHLAWLAIAFLLGIASGAIIISFNRRSSPSSIMISTRIPVASPVPTGTPGPLTVYISGEIVKPDVYELPAGAIIQDLVESAGGFTEMAENEVVNLAFALDDGMHIHVPSRVEEISIPIVSEGSGAGGPSSEGTVNINQAALQDLEALPGIGPSLAQAILDYRDINGVFHEIDEIMEVPGIGPVKFEDLKPMISVK